MSIADASGNGAPSCSDEELAVLIESITESQDDFDIDRALAAAARVEAETDSVELHMRARLLRADALDRSGQAGAAARLAWEVNRWASENNCRLLLAESHRHLSASYHYIGDAGSCLDHAVRALELLDDDASPLNRGRYLCVLADALGWMGSFDEARRRYASAEEIYVGLGDVQRRLQVLNNLAYTEHEAGRPEQAWVVAQRMMALAAAHEVPLREIYHDAVARAQMGIGRPADAERTLSGALATFAPTADQADLLAELLLTLAEAQRQRGATQRAQDSLDRCRRLCEERSLAEVRVRVLKEQAELYAAGKDFERAYELHKVFSAESDALRSAEREARAWIREAMFETSEARQDARRFWEQARRDPLTGLHNRRFADERLPVLVAQSGQGDTPAWVALVDVDHFKRVNDKLSHDVGDRVLVTVARLLNDFADAGGGDDEVLVARMGGEEFLIALRAADSDTAFRRLDEVRLRIGSHPWRPITGDLPVTVSIGAAPAVVGSTQSSVLARADERLYAAKHAGRDRVVIGS